MPQCKAGRRRRTRRRPRCRRPGGSPPPASRCIGTFSSHQPAAWRSVTSHQCGGVVALDSQMCPSISHICIMFPLSAGILFLMNVHADVRQLLHEQPAGAITLRALDTALRCTTQCTMRH